MSDAELTRISELAPTDEDRVRVLNLLRTASSRLGLDEAERRMDAAVKAPTKAELALLVWDLPDATSASPPDVAPPKVSALRSLAFRLHGTTYGLVNAMLIGIWGITDSNHLFWPFFPIAGWGIGLGAHAVVARGAQRAQYEKQIKRLEKRGRGELATSRAARELTPPWDEAPTVRPGRGPDRTDRPASGPPAVGEAKPARVVVMFTDMVDSTRLTMVIGDEDWTRVRSRYRQLLTEAYAGFGGQEVSAQGDGFLARFSRPGDAVQCAVDIQRRIQAQRNEYGFAPAVRIGINSGDAMEEQGDVLGTTVNIAARVTSAAEPNEILVTEAVADQMDDRFQIRDGGLRPVKGLDRQTHVLIISW
ncbi:MAG TPA: adenylate/guanylate cyclase domain-containing protein [Acidimicrobiales bacterium]|jgi:class 3 adenylate cyclase|nr:adenylate/guanylate cyclase domain-containing protein [Acidimicrobiales bacterium]